LSYDAYPLSPSAGEAYSRTVRPLLTGRLCDPY